MIAVNVILAVFMAGLIVAGAVDWRKQALRRERYRRQRCRAQVRRIQVATAPEPIEHVVARMARIHGFTR